MAWRRIPWSQHFLELGEDEFLEENHQGIHFLPRAAPVFGGESEKREIGDPELAAVLNRLAHGLGALLMARDAVQGPLLGPPAVSIHDDG